MRPDILVVNGDFCLRHLHSMPPLGGSHHNISVTFDMEKIRMVWLPDGEKNLEDMFICFDRFHERDRHPDRQTPHDSIGCAYA